MNPAMLHKIYIAAIVLIIVIGALGVHYYIDHLEANAAAEADRKAREEQNRQLASENDSLKSQIADVQSDMAAKLDAIARLRISVVTPQQAATVIHDETPLKSATVAAAPDAPSVLSQKDSISLAQFSLQCKACDTELSALRAVNEKQAEQLKNDDGQIANLKKEVSDAETEAKGGKIGKRIRKSLKVIACSGIGGAIGAMSKQNRPIGAAAGAASGALLCTLF